jgi:regulator of sirC expression with transglutaminase-like and TPR domain
MFISSRWRYPEITVEWMRAEIEAIVTECRSLLGPPPPQSPHEVLSAVNTVLFERRGMRGNSSSYYDEDNSLLAKLLVSGKGIPISLSALYRTVCLRLGLELDCIGSPGHFLLGVPGGELFVDAFSGGRLLTLAEFEGLMSSFNIPDPGHPRHRSKLGVRQVWVRSLRNLEHIYRQEGRDLAAFAVLSQMLEIEPGLIVERARHCSSAIRLKLFEHAQRDVEALQTMVGRPIEGAGYYMGQDVVKQIQTVLERTMAEPRAAAPVTWEVQPRFHVGQLVRHQSGARALVVGRGPSGYKLLMESLEEAAPTRPVPTSVLLGMIRETTGLTKRRVRA